LEPGVRYNLSCFNGSMVSSFSGLLTQNLLASVCRKTSPQLRPNESTTSCFKRVVESPHPWTQNASIGLWMWALNGRPRIQDIWCGKCGTRNWRILKYVHLSFSCVFCILWMRKRYNALAALIGRRKRPLSSYPFVSNISVQKTYGHAQVPIGWEVCCFQKQTLWLLFDSSSLSPPDSNRCLSPIINSSAKCSARELGVYPVSLW